MLVSPSRPPLAARSGLPGRAAPPPRSEFDDAILGLFTERNSDGTAYLVLRGKDIHDRYGRRIQDTDIKTICRYIKQCRRRITRLDLCYNEITDTGFFLLLKQCLVKGRSSLNNVNIMNNELTDVSLERLAMYAMLVRLKYLRINGNKFGAKFYVESETQPATTSKRSPIGNPETPRDVIRRYHSHINQVLNLSRVVPLFNRYQYETKWLAYHLELLLTHNGTLIELHLQKNQLTCHDAESLVRGLRRNTALLYLDLAFNRLGDAGAGQLAAHLRAAPPLVLLSLAGNGVGDGGARALSYGMPFSHVRALDLSHNLLTDEGILSLLHTIKKPSYMRFLNLWGNRIGHASCEVINRMILSGVLFQHTIDVCIYEVDNVLCAAYYPNPADRGKHLYYCELEYGQAQGIIKIKRNRREEQKRPVKVDCKHQHRLDKTDRDHF